MTETLVFVRVPQVSVSPHNGSIRKLYLAVDHLKALILYNHLFSGHYMIDYCIIASGGSDSKTRFHNLFWHVTFMFTSYNSSEFEGIVLYFQEHAGTVKVIYIQ